MADKSVSLKITGLSELNRAFKDTDSELPKKMKEKLLGVAGNVARKAAASMPHKTGRAAGSIKAGATSRGASISAYGSRVPYGMWLDFGGKVGRHKSITRDWMGRPSGEGRYVYPAISSEKENTRIAVDQAIKEVAHSAEFDTNGEI